MQTLRNDISDGNLRAGGRLIGADSSIRVQDAAIAAAAATAAERASSEALQVGAWSGRTNQAMGSVQGSGSAMVSRDRVPHITIIKM